MNSVTSLQVTMFCDRLQAALANNTLQDRV